MQCTVHVAYGLPLCRNIVSRTGLNARYPPTKLYRIMPVRDGVREKEKRVERTQPVANVLWPRCYCKAINLGLPLEETGLTAPPTLHCPISSRSIAWPSIIDSHSTLPRCYFLYYSRVQWHELFLVEKSCVPERLPRRDSSFETFHEKLERDLLFLHFNHFAKLPFCDLFEKYLDSFDLVKISSLSYLWDTRLFFSMTW